jgi:hypothetical protein
VRALSTQPTLMLSGLSLASLVSWVACASTSAGEHELDAGEPFTCVEPTALSFKADPGDADEAVVCFAFDASSVGLTALGGVVWKTTDPSSATRLHHATLYAAPSDFPSGPVSCDGMPPGAVGLHVWSPGGDDLELPDDVALAIPPGTRQLVIEAHVLRDGDQRGAAGSATATLCAASPAAVHQAAFLGYGAPVPALRPMHDEESDGACELQRDAHLWSVWPHMHLAGSQITVRLRSADGTVRELVDVSPLRFHQQVTYRLAIDARAGDTLETRCRWRNDTDTYILPGPRTQDEMCNTGLIIWPIEAAACR